MTSHDRAVYHDFVAKCAGFALFLVNDCVTSGISIRRFFHTDARLTTDGVTDLVRIEVTSRFNDSLLLMRNCLLVVCSATLFLMVIALLCSFLESDEDRRK